MAAVGRTAGDGVGGDYDQGEKGRNSGRGKANKWIVSCTLTGKKNYRVVSQLPNARSDDLRRRCAAISAGYLSPPFEVNLRLNPSQSKAATDAESSQNTTTIYLLRSRKISEKSRFNVENAAINLQPKLFAEGP
jgi:hypothetical protein